VDFPSRHKNDAGASAGLVFIRAYNKWHTRIKKALRETGITHPQFVVMTALAYLSQSVEYVSQARVAALADMDEMSVSQIARSLEKSGFLRRSDNPLDVRSYAIDLTDKGAEAVRAALPIVEAIDDDFFGVLGEEKTPFLACLRRLIEA
jgi:DNA-binding MarR family transcriptional regulator